MKIILSIDYGKKFTGLALFNKEADPFPMPYERIPYQSDIQLIKEIQKYAKIEDADTLVLGVPKLLDGRETSMSQEMRSFGQLLEKKTSLSIYYQDETLSTYEAKKRMENSARYNFQVDMRKVDALAACIILEDFVATH